MFGLFAAGKGKAEKTRQSRKADHDELILKLAQYVCAISPGKPMKVLRLGGSMETKSASGEAGFQYQIETDCGFGNLFIFPRFASVWMTSEPEPRHSLPMQMIENDLKAWDKGFQRILRNRYPAQVGTLPWRVPATLGNPADAEITTAAIIACVPAEAHTGDVQRSAIALIGSRF